MSNRKNLGKRLKYFRELRALTTRKLGEYTKMSHSYISELESGKAENPSLKKLTDLSLGLNVPLEYFFEELPENVAESLPIYEARTASIADEST